MLIADFDYELPESAIAQQPLEPRDSAKLLDASGAEVVHRHVRDLPDVLLPGDLVVVNDTKVLPARLHLRKQSGGAAEVLLLEPQNLATGEWQALVRPGKTLAPGAQLHAENGTHVVTVGERIDDGKRLVTLHADAHEFGEMPLPPYITEVSKDPDRYQTVYARNEGSAAAPTAGLHFTQDTLQRLTTNGIDFARVDLTVGLDTFRPVAVEDTTDHKMHSERYSIPATTVEALNRAQRVVAIGTTTVRALESFGQTGQTEGRTELFITPGFEFTYVDLLMTNFHLPKSTLLLMISGFAGDGWKDLYQTALRNNYRFLSFGDAMLLKRTAAKKAV